MRDKMRLLGTDRELWTMRVDALSAILIYGYELSRNICDG
jgi:hypothetical protein